MQHRYVHGQSVDDPVVWYPGASVATTNQRHLVADRQGSIVAVADSNGNALGLNRYDEYGNPSTTVAGSGQLFGRFGYTGQIWLPELGLWYYKARLYSGPLGRFLQVDPVGYEDQFNLYTYVANDPLNRIDSMGLADIYVGGGFDDWFTHIVENYSNQHGGKYFSWTDKIALMGELRRASAAGETINLIGHSLGGSAAIMAADWTGAKINLLITIDPVGPVTLNPFSEEVDLDNVNQWVNVTSTPVEDILDDRIATAGGRTSRSVTTKADVNRWSKMHHGQFRSMMKEIGAEEMLKEDKFPEPCETGTRVCPKSK